MTEGEAKDQLHGGELALLGRVVDALCATDEDTSLKEQVRRALESILQNKAERAKMILVAMVAQRAIRLQTMLERVNTVEDRLFQAERLESASSKDLVSIARYSRDSVNDILVFLQEFVAAEKVEEEQPVNGLELLARLRFSGTLPKDPQQREVLRNLFEKLVTTLRTNDGARCLGPGVEE